MLSLFVRRQKQRGSGDGEGREIITVVQKKVQSRYYVTPVAFLVLILLYLLFIMQPTFAHPPSNMELEYDFAEQTLSVTITHSVPGPGDHYVKRIEIRKNGDLDLSEDYTSQPTTSTFTYTYAVAAGDGDVLEATAHCSLFGTITEQITVSVPSSVSTQPTPTMVEATPSPSPSPVQTPSPSPTQTPGFEILFAVISIVATSYFVKRKC
jgi:hypothetical protein